MKRRESVKLARTNYTKSNKNYRKFVMSLNIKRQNSLINSGFCLLILMLIIFSATASAERGRIEEKDKNYIIQLMKNYLLKLDEKSSDASSEYCDAFLTDFRMQDNIIYPKPLISTNVIDDIWKSPHFSNCNRQGYDYFGSHQSEPYFELFNITKNNKKTDAFVMIDSGFGAAVNRNDDETILFSGHVQYRFLNKKNCFGGHSWHVDYSEKYKSIIETLGKDYVTTSKHAVLEYKGNMIYLRLLDAKSRPEKYYHLQLSMHDVDSGRFKILCFFR